MPEVTVRPASSSDAEAIHTLARETWHAAYDEILGPETVDETIDNWYDLESLTESIENATRREDTTFLVADTEQSDIIDDSDRSDFGADTTQSDLVGFTHVGPHPDLEGVGSLIRIYVSPGRWGDGIGTILLERTEAAAQSTYDRLRLAVLEGNDVGIGFYESRGFERVSERESGLDSTVVEYIYEKPL